MILNYILCTLGGIVVGMVIGGVTILYDAKKHHYKY